MSAIASLITIASMGRGGWAGRIGLVVALTAALLVPQWISPTKAVAVPETLARSVVLGAPGRVALAFPATHIAFSWRGGDETGVMWRRLHDTATKWRRAPEAHDLEVGDRHFSGVLVVARPAAIEWRPVKGPREVLLDYLNTQDGPLVERSIPAVAMATPETPLIVTRAEWGADETLKRTEGGCMRAFYPVTQLFVHHTAGSNFDPDPYATMRATYWYHTVRRGWCDIGYNFVIGPDGTVFEGRWARRYAYWETHSSENRDGYGVRGSHTAGFNSGSVGISLMGNFTTVEPTPEARRALTEVLAWESDRHDLDPLGRHLYRNPDSGTTKTLPFIAGHRDAGATACPGDRLYRSMDDIRSETAALVGTGKTNSTLDLTAPTTASSGQTVRVTGRLSDAAGVGFIARTVSVYRRLAGARWQLYAETITTADGGFTTDVVADATMKLVAVYPGDGSTWGSLSPIVKVAVETTTSPTPISTA